MKTEQDDTCEVRQHRSNYTAVAAPGKPVSTASYDNERPAINRAPFSTDTRYVSTSDRALQGTHFQILFNPTDAIVKIVWSTDAMDLGMNSIELTAARAIRVGRHLLRQAKGATGTFSFQIDDMPQVTMPAPDALTFLMKFVRAAQTARGGIN